jgi:hypothetical protein
LRLKKRGSIMKSNIKKIARDMARGFAVRTIRVAGALQVLALTSMIGSAASLAQVDLNAADSGLAAGAVSAADVFLVTEAAEPQAALARNVVADCTGTTTRAVVRRQAASGRLAMYVYQYGRLAASGYVTKRLSGAGTGVTILSYKFGSVLDGGASLRIRSRSPSAPGTTGMGHLTFNGSNELVECAIY